MVEGGYVHRLTCLVWRWGCGLCGATFRLLPPFIQPYKRYCTFSIDKMASKVLDPHHSSYREASHQSRTDRSRITHHWNPDKAALAHTTIWRWIVWMSAMTLLIVKLQPQSSTDETILRAEADRCQIPPERWKMPCRLDQIHLARWLKRNRKLGKDRLPRNCNTMN